MEPIFGVPKKQVYDMDAAELEIANRSVSERQKGRYCREPLRVYNNNNPSPSDTLQDLNLGVGVETMSKIHELRKKHEAEVADLLKAAEAELPEIPLDQPRQS